MKFILKLITTDSHRFHTLSFMELIFFSLSKETCILVGRPISRQNCGPFPGRVSHFNTTNEGGIPVSG